MLVKDGKPYWLGMGQELPDDGRELLRRLAARARQDAEGKEIPPAHKNARYAVALKALANCDPELENPEGVVLGGIMYGGRDAEVVRAGPAELRLGARHHRLRRVAGDGDHVRHHRQGRRARNQPDEHPGFRGHPAGQVRPEQPGLRRRS